MTKALSRSRSWRPAKWSPGMGGFDLKTLKVPFESAVGFGGGLVGGLIIRKPLAALMNVSEFTATAVLGLLSAGIPAVLSQQKMISKPLANFFYGLGGGFAASMILQVVQVMLTPPPPPPAQAPPVPATTR